MTNTDTLTTVEDQFAVLVADVLDEVADEFAHTLDGADEIVAARFSVSRIARMWAARVPRLVQRLLGIVETAAHRAADDVDASLPDGWDDLPARHTDGRPLPDGIGQYVETTEQFLTAVGERLAAAARDALAAGVAAGEDADALRARLRAVFARDAAQLGDVRADRIARTEATRAWNTATLAAARALTGPDRPLVKQWVTRHDPRVRHAHDEVDGQLRLLDEPFTVAGVAMSAPGDPTAPPELVINCRCRLAVAHAGDRSAAAVSRPTGQEHTTMQPDDETTAAGVPARAWSTPGDTAIAFENQETGDGRIFAPGALYWEGGPWPLQYADEMLMGHEGAELAGAIQSLGRDGDRITAAGVIYPGRPAGADALTLLEEGAPLGISVDLDDVDVEFVDRTGDEDGGGLTLAASLSHVGLLHMDDGSWCVTVTTAPEWTAAGTGLSRGRHNIQFITSPGGTMNATGARGVLAHIGALTAAAGDPDDPAGTVVHSESTGDLLVRITRARLRGATLVAMPAYDRARIVLDDTSQEPEQQPYTLAAAGSTISESHQAVVAHVAASPVPVGAREVAKALGITMDAARWHLTRAAEAGRIVKLGRGQYVGASTLPEGAEVSAALPDDTDLPAAGDHDEEPDEMTELEASAWTAMREADPLPAAWFREPTAEELPPGSGGVHYADGRVYGWVAQAGEPHAGYPGRNLTVESLGDLDMSHFLRARFKLDDGTFVKAGAFTMNVPHHRDGAECESAACQFDDTRTVAGIVTVGMNERGLWFSGAAAPWLSEWDRSVFQACQPSYHMKQGPAGKWQLRAVLSVPVPGHSSPLLASAVAERANLALAASAAGALTVDEPPADPVPAEAAADTAADSRAALTAALTDPAFLDAFADALDRRRAEREEAARAELARLTAAVAPAREEITASTGDAYREDHT